MKLTCPVCGMNYHVEEERITDPSSRLRCRSCQSVFSLEEGGRGNPGEEEAESISASSNHILICDDAPFFRAMLNDILTEAGYEVETASNGEEALRKIAASPPGLLILDLQMPGINGFEVIKSIRSGDTSASLPILAVSAVFTDSSDMMELEDAGADDYIGKQFKPDHLLKRVLKLLGPPVGSE